MILNRPMLAVVDVHSDGLDARVVIPCEIDQVSGGVDDLSISTSFSLRFGPRNSSGTETSSEWEMKASKVVFFPSNMG